MYVVYHQSQAKIYKEFLFLTVFTDSFQQKEITTQSGCVHRSRKSWHVHSYV